MLLILYVITLLRYKFKYRNLHEMVDENFLLRDKAIKGEIDK